MNELHINKNTVVTLDFTMRDGDGNLIDSSQDGGDFLVYLHGHGQIPPVLENTLLGRKLGEEITCSLSPSEGFGERDENACITVDRAEFSEVENLEEGMPFYLSLDGDVDHQQVFRVTDIEADEVVLDANHPLAGLTTVWQCKVVGVREATQEEIDHGHIHGEGGHHHEDDETSSAGGCGEGCNCH